jgi:hypothetical protein
MNKKSSNKSSIKIKLSENRVIVKKTPKKIPVLEGVVNGESRKIEQWHKEGWFTERHVAFIDQMDEDSRKWFFTIQYATTVPTVKSLREQGYFDITRAERNNFSPQENKFISVSVVFQEKLIRKAATFRTKNEETYLEAQTRIPDNEYFEVLQEIEKFKDVSTIVIMEFIDASSNYDDKMVNVVYISEYGNDWVMLGSHF